MLQFRVEDEGCGLNSCKDGSLVVVATVPVTASPGNETCQALESSCYIS